MFRKRPAPDGEELLARLASLTTRAKELAELRRSQVELAIALQRDMLPADLPAVPGIHLA
ncbi:serine/threonine-protein phosphatase, partial [Streptomyces violaceoruber]